MATIDIITRVDALCKKYEKYDVDKHKQEAMSSSDNYVRLFSQIESDLEVALQVRPTGAVFLCCLLLLLPNL
jgi:SYP7 family syntaxin